MYLPAMSVIALSYDAHVTTVQQSLSIYLAGLCSRYADIRPIGRQIWS